MSCQFQIISLLPAKMFRGRGRAAKPQILRKSASGNTQYKLTQASTFPGPRFSTSGHRSKGSPPLHSAQALPPLTCQWALPLDPSSALPPLHPATEGSPPSVLPHRRSWLPPQKRLPPVSPAPHPHIYAFRLEVDTEYACGDCRSKHQVQPRHFDRNLPDFRLFFLPPLPPESHAPLRRHWRRLSVPHCTAG